MANIKLTGNTWDTSGIYDATQSKTQAQVNADVTDLSSQISEYKVQISVTPTWEQGSISSSNGANSSSSTRIRTNYIAVNPKLGFSLNCPSGYKYFLYGYESAAYASYVGKITNDWETGSATYPSLLSTINYVRVVLANTGDTSITPSDAVDIGFKNYSATDKTLSVENKAADAKAVGRFISNQIKISIQWQQGEYRTDTGAGKQNSTIIRSIYQVPFKQYISITVPKGYKLKWFQYTGLSYTTFTQSSDWLTGTVKVCEDGNWYKFCLTKTDGTDLSPSDVANIDFNVIVGERYDTLRTEYASNSTTLAVAILSCYNTLKIPSGEYVIASSITLKDNQSVVGEGFNSIVRFDDSASGACFICGNGNTIANLQIKGRDEDYVLENPEAGQEAVPSTEGDRYGIIITGTKKRGVIFGLWVHGFDGYALKTYSNSTTSSQGWSISNCYFTNNYGGIYIRTSEFHRIENCDCNINYIGIFLGGGNVPIANCNFSSNYYGINMDNSDGLSTNNTHGNVVGCIIQHNRTNAVYINGMSSGEVFSGCNIDNGGVSITNSHRIIFNACNFMSEFSVAISGGGFVMFNGCNMRDYTASHTTITNNTKVKFINCYNEDAEEIDPTA